MDFKPATLLILISFLFLHKSFGIKDREKIEWVPISLFKPNDQEPAGADGYTKLFFGRVNLGNGNAVAAYSPERKFFFPDEGGQLQTVDDTKIKVLKYCSGGLSWTRRSCDDDSKIPNDAFPSGVDPATGENIFACRARRGDRMIPGQLLKRPNSGCLIVDDGVIEDVKDYELASLSYYSIAAGCAVKG